MIRQLLWLVLLVFSPPTGQIKGEELISLIFESRVDIPDIEIDGRTAVVHTQGLFVTDDHFFVTGRLERLPKRALFIRFDRTNPCQFDVLDITPTEVGRGSETTDHPGGFDFDGEGFWIPVARSEPGGPTVVIRTGLQPNRPFGEWKWRPVFRVDDHIGALAWEPTQRRLYGANWDTQYVYTWTPRGDQIQKSSCDAWIKGLIHWGSAIQDWKTVGNSLPFPPETLVAGGINKWPGRDRTKSAAIVEWIDPIRRTRLARVFVPRVSGWDGPVTREGLAIHQGRLYCLPGDVGRGAQVYCFRIEMARP